MAFLLDANIPYSAKEVFPKNTRVSHVRDIGLDRASDEEIIKWAKRKQAVLVTRDFDFANILHFPPKQYSGIVILKVPYFYSGEAIKRVLADFLSNTDEKSLAGHVVVVEEGRFRIR